MSKVRLQNMLNISNLAKSLSILLRDLTFSDNYKSFIWTGTIPANSEQSIRNSLKVQANSYIIKFQTGNALITASTTDWDNDYVYMFNHDSTNDAYVEIIFWRE